MLKWLLIGLGTITWSVTMVKSGLMGQYGLGFWGPNGHDGIWHIALIKNISRGFFDMPVFAGLALKNYHLGFDVLVAALHLLTSISVSTLYFQVLPPIFAFLIGLLTYCFIKLISKSQIAAWWSTFFVYFGGSLAWLVGGGESHFWAQQAISTLVNPPFALSLVILLLGMIGIQRRNLALSVICFILLPHIKVYAGLLGFAGLAVGGLKDRLLWKVLLISALIGVPLYLAINPSSQGLIIFQPGWFLESLFAPDRLNVPRFFSALNTYRVGQVWPKLFPAFMLAFIIFVVGNMGSRLLACFILIKWPRLGHKITWFELFIATILLCGVLIPMVFTQKGTAWNTIQFFYYTLFFSSLLSGISVSLILKKLNHSKLLSFVISLFVIVFTLPTTVITLGQYLPNRPPAKLDRSELAGLKVLANQPRGTVLTVPFDVKAAADAVVNPPRPLYLYESTAYVSAYSGQPTYLADEVNLTITDYSWQDRRQQSTAFFVSDPETQLKFLLDNQIRYIYLVGNSKLNVPLSNLDLLYSESGVWLFRVKS